MEALKMWKYLNVATRWDAESDWPCQARRVVFVGRFILQLTDLLQLLVELPGQRLRGGLGIYGAFSVA